MLKNYKKKKITVFGNGKQKRDFLHVNDLNEAIYRSIKFKKSKNQIYNLGSGIAQSILYLKNIISKSKDHIFLEKRKDDIEVSISNIDKIKRHLKWSPNVSLVAGVKEMIESDKKRLLRMKIISVKSQQKLIKFFNNN